MKPFNLIKYVDILKIKLYHIIINNKNHVLSPLSINSFGSQEDYIILKNVINEIIINPEIRYIFIDFKTLADFSPLGRIPTFLKFFEGLVEKNIKFIFINISKKIIDNIEYTIPNETRQSILLPYIIDDIKDIQWIGSIDTSLKDEICKLFIDLQIKTIDDIKRKIIDHDLIKIGQRQDLDIIRSIKKDEPLSTSGFYGDVYFNLKKISFYPNMVYDISYELTYFITNGFKNNLDNIDLIVCPSHISIIFGNLVSNILNKDMVIIDRLGFNKNIKYNESLFDITNKNVIIISDVVCSGTELDITKSIVEILGGIIIGIYTIYNLEVLNKEIIKDSQALCYPKNKLNYHYWISNKTN